MRIQHNMMAINANRNLASNNNMLSKSLEKLSSGYAINRAGDNAAGLAISEKMRAQIKCLDQAESNCNDGVSLIQTAEGALNEVHDMLNRMVELAEQSANGTYDNDVDRANLDSEVQQLKEEIDRIATATNFNGITLLNGNLVDSVATNQWIKYQEDNSGTITDYSLGVHINYPADHDDQTRHSENIVTLDVYSDSAANAPLVKTTKDATTGNVKVEFNIAKSDFSYTEKQMRDLLRTATGKEGLQVSFLNGIEKLEFPKETTDITYATGVNDTTGAFDSNSELTLQIGDTADDYNQLSVAISAMTCDGLKIENLDVLSLENGSTAMGIIKDAINKVSMTRGTLGAMQNRLEHTMNNLNTTNENITEAESRIRDTDMAKEMMSYTSKSILSQAAQSMLSQANQVPQQVLQLLQA